MSITDVVAVTALVTSIINPLVTSIVNPSLQRRRELRETVRANDEDEFWQLEHRHEGEDWATVMMDREMQAWYHHRWKQGQRDAARQAARRAAWRHWLKQRLHR